MKPVYQTLFKPPAANCFQAAMASVLELPLDDVPNFVLEERWWQAANDFLRPRDLYLITVPAQEEWTPIGYHLVAGPSPRLNGWHCLVGLNGQPIFDPHPSGNCKLGTQERWEWHLFVSMMKGWKPDGQ